MMVSVTLHGYRFSVYSRIARLILEEKGVGYAIEDVNPFEGDAAAEVLKWHPFGFVPVLSHGDFHLYETSAIGRYVDAAFVGPPLTPETPAAVARMAQVIAIIDAYGYRPMIRQLFENRVFLPMHGETFSAGEIGAGLVASRRVLAALEVIAAEGKVLTGDRFTLADCHLAPMIAYFAAAPEGAEMLRAFSALSDWWEQAAARSSLMRTDPWSLDGSG